MGKYISNDMYLADFESHNIDECLDICDNWESRCPSIQSEEKWRHKNPCDKRCGVFVFSHGTQCTLFTYAPELTFSELDVAAWAHDTGNSTMGPCKPSGDYTENECCPTGYVQIKTIDECKAAYDTLIKFTPLKDVSWGGEVEMETRPSGCFLYPGDNDVHFNPLNVTEIGEELIGDDRVLCREEEVAPED